MELLKSVMQDRMPAVSFEVVGMAVLGAELLQMSSC